MVGHANVDDDLWRGVGKPPRFTGRIKRIGRADHLLYYDSAAALADAARDVLGKIDRVEWVVIVSKDRDAVMRRESLYDAVNGVGLRMVIRDHSEDSTVFGGFRFGDQFIRSRDGQNVCWRVTRPKEDVERLVSKGAI